MKLLKILILFSILIGKPAIHYGQSSIPADTCNGICYTDQQDKVSIECLLNAPKHQKRIFILRAEVVDLTFKVVLYEDLSREQKVLIEDLTHRLEKSERKRRILKNILLITSGIIAIETVIIILL